MNLLVDPVKENKVRILDIEKYEETFGPKCRRKKVKLNTTNYSELLEEAEQKGDKYDLADDVYHNKEQIEEE